MASSTPTPKPPNFFVRFTRKIYGPLGFRKGYNFTLFFISAGALLGFTLARLEYLNFNGIYLPESAPGESYWQSNGHYKSGLILHLACILPASLLVILQFVPAIRHKLIIFHRVNGYVVILLILTSNAGALMIARRAFGGSIETQTGVGLLAIIVTVGIGMAYYNIKRLQIDQHRAWMLRSMFAMTSIITLRLILFLAALITTAMQNYYLPLSCSEIAWFYSNYGLGSPLDTYPRCSPSPSSNTTTSSSSTSDVYVAVNANLDSTPDQIGASLDINFGMAIWLALFLHMVGVEIYLRLTPGEAERLRVVSWKRQMQRGWKWPGSAGLTSDRWGDARRWEPPKGKVEVGERKGEGGKEEGEVGV